MDTATIRAMMSEEASSIGREAKRLHQELKAVLAKSREPWDREIEFQRKNLQKQYLTLLLTYPHAKESKDAETHLWMSTSYALITLYKKHLATVEDSLRDGGAQKQPGRPQRHGPVEHRKLMQRFKQFLAQEEKFWTQLVVRLQRQFELTEARAALVQLGLLSSSDDPATDAGDVAEDDVSTGRSHFRFPPEPHDPQSPLTPARHASHLTTLGKALICLGDLARYREQYSEGNGRPHPGNEQGPRRGGRNRRQAAEQTKSRNYDKARMCYERARDLVPNEGNASHQLAILASYQKDTFESLVHYYRAICVQVSYDPAAENMGNVLSKFLDVWHTKRGKAKASPEDGNVRDQARAFKDDVVLVHALWRRTREQMDAIAPGRDDQLVEEFSTLVSTRALSIDTILKVFVLAHGALWKHQMVHAALPGSSKRPSEPIIIESRILAHILALHTALLQRGTVELEESAKIVEDDPAMRITATFRRMLPALRVAGKWLRANLSYVQEPPAPIAQIREFWDTYNSFATSIAKVFPLETLPKLRQPLEEDIELRAYLPLKGLLSGDNQDIDNAGQEPDVNERSPEQVHPNEEQLMRVWDVWHDAKILADARGTPMESFDHTSRQAQGEEINVQDIKHVSKAVGETDWRALPPAKTKNAVIEVDEDAKTEATDPVGDAFRQVLNVSEEPDDEEEDEIVWDPRVTSPPSHAGPLSNMPTPHAQAHPSTSPVSPISPLKRNVDISPVSAPHLSIKGVSAQNASSISTNPHKTTAQDLLDNVLGRRKPALGIDLGPRNLTHPLPPSQQPLYSPEQPLHSPMGQQHSAPPPPLLFGPTTHGGYGTSQSIWATAPDEDSLQYRQRQPSGSYPLVLPLAENQPVSPGSWPSFTQLQTPQPPEIRPFPSTSFSQTLMPNTHRRVPSASMQMDHGYGVYDQQDPVFYSSNSQNIQPIGSFASSIASTGMSIAPPVHPIFAEAVAASRSSSSLYMQNVPQSRHRPYGSLDASKYEQQRVGSIWGGAG